MISEKVTGQKINSSSERKNNEKHLIKREFYLPIRYYNFKYALSECGFNVEKALQYAKKELFDLAGNPIFLPDVLSTFNINKKGQEEVVNYMSYTKILQAVFEKDRELINKKNT